MTPTPPQAMATIAHHAINDYVSDAYARIATNARGLTVAELTFPDGGRRWVTSDGWGNYRDDYPVPSGATELDAVRIILAVHGEKELAV